MWTTFSDVQDRWITGVIPASETQVVTLIGDAEDTVLREFPDIQTRIDTGELPEERVVKVVARMVERKLRNPTGQRSQTQGAGPFQQSITFGGDEPGAMYLTDADRYELAGSTSKRGKSFALDMTPSTYTKPYAPDVWEPLT